MKTLIIILLTVIASISSTCIAQDNAKIIKVKDILSEQQLSNLTDSTGMIYVPNLVRKIMDYTPNCYLINLNKKEALNKIIKEVKMHMIPGDMSIIVTGEYQNAGIYLHEDSYGRIDFSYRTIEDPILYIDIQLAKRYKYIFASK